MLGTLVSPSTETASDRRAFEIHRIIIGSFHVQAYGRGRAAPTARSSTVDAHSDESVEVLRSEDVRDLAFDLCEVLECLLGAHLLHMRDC